MCLCVCVLVRLKKLSLSNTLVTDEGLVSLQSLQELVELCLDRTTVTSKGVARCITCLPHLQVLPALSLSTAVLLTVQGLIANWSFLHLHSHLVDACMKNINVNTER